MVNPICIAGKTKQKRKPLAKHEMRWGYTFLLPSMLGTSIFILLPSLDTLRMAFTAPGRGFAGLNNFISVLGNDAFHIAAVNTIRFMVTCVPLLLLISLILALLLNSKIGRNPALRAGFLLPMAIPVASVALLWQLFFNNHGALNGYLSNMNLKTMDWMNSKLAFWVLVGSYLWRNLGYDMVLLLAALSNISLSLYEAADVDGAGSWRKFTSITLPQLGPSLYVVTVLSLLNTFKVFREAYLAAGSYPHDSIYMLQHLYNNWFSKLEMDKLSAAAVLTALVICALIALLQRKWKMRCD
jgi:multiple sugar transport system permease protein